MFHQEKVIDGVLHWRGTPDGEFKRYTDEQLTVIIERLLKESRG